MSDGGRQVRHQGQETGGGDDERRHPPGAPVRDGASGDGRPGLPVGETGDDHGMGQHRGSGQEPLGHRRPRQQDLRVKQANVKFVTRL